MLFLRFFSIEARKLFKHPVLWLEFAGLLGIVGFYFAARAFLILRSPHAAASSAWAMTSDLQGGLQLYRLVGVVFYASITAFVAGADLPERGVQVWLARGVPRSVLLLARTSLVLLLSFLLVAILVCASLGGGALTDRLMLGPKAALSADWMQLAAATLYVFWGTVPYLGLAILLSFVSRSPLFGAAGTLVFQTVLEGGLLRLAGRFPNLIRFLPAQLALVLEASVYGPDRAAKAISAGAPLLTGPQAALAIGALLLCSVALTLVIFRLQDWGG
jgi:hypothetical protein